MKITARFLFENMAEDVKKANGIRAAQRLDCTQISGIYEGLDAFKNKKGIIYLFPTETNDFVECDGKRIATMALTNGTLNLSSLYIENLDFPQFAYGYPNARPKLRDGSPNPLLPYRQDGYLFLTDTDLKRVELFVIEGGRNYIREAYSRFIDGELDTDIERLRASARPLYKYEGLF
jgi:hypothetical protein